MFVIDLSGIQPLDIILTTGGAKESWWIRALQSVLQRKTADFSHAAMFIAPTVLVESSDAGVVLEVFSNRTPGDETLDGAKVRERFRHYNRSKRLKTRILFDKEPDRLRILGALPDATRVKVVRHRAFKNVKPGPFVRDQIIEALRSVYLQAYPSYAELMRTAQIPDAVIAAFRRMAARLLGPIYNPGPFCSELVCLLLAHCEATLSRGAAATAPAHIASSDEYYEVKIVCEMSDSDAASMIAPDIEKLLEFVPTPLLSPLVEHGTAIAQRIAQESRTLDQVVYSPSQFAQNELERLRKWCSTVSDQFWLWHVHAPSCFADCADRVRRQAANEADPARRRWITPCESLYECRSPAGLERVRKAKDALVDWEIARVTEC